MTVSPSRRLNGLTLSLMMVAATASLRTLPPLAVHGVGSVALVLIPALVFFLPLALVAAELGSGWRGGLYGWVKQAFGDRMGFVASWCLWIQAVIGFPLVLTVAARAVATLLPPSLATRGLFITVVVLVLSWLCTVLALAGLRTVATLSARFLVVGTLAPAIVLVLLGLSWVLTGHASAAPLTLQAWLSGLLPAATKLGGLPRSTADLGGALSGVVGVLALLASHLQAFTGLEMNALHTRSLANPQKEIPRAIALAGGLTLLILIPTTVAIALVVPARDISLTAGVMEAYAALLTRLDLGWAIKGMALVLVIGVLGGVLTWTAGPSTGLLLAARSGALPRWWQATNAQGMPRNILLAQAGLVTLLVIGCGVLPEASAARLLQALAIQLYLLLYGLVFASALRLRQLQPHVKRGFVCPNLPFWGRLGLAVALLAFVLGLLPPEATTRTSPISHVALQLSGLLVLVAPPLLVHANRQKRWQVVPAVEVDQATAAIQDLSGPGTAARRL